MMGLRFLKGMERFQREPDPLFGVQDGVCGQGWGVSKQGRRSGRFMSVSGSSSTGHSWWGSGCSHSARRHRHFKAITSPPGRRLLKSTDKKVHLEPFEKGDVSQGELLIRSAQHLQGLSGYEFTS